MENKSYLIGFAVGFISVLVIALIIRIIAKKKCSPCEFDERQQIARGKAYKSGFFTTLITIAVLMCVYIGFENNLPIKVSFSTVLFIILCLGVTVFAIQSIWTDAYFSIKSKPLQTTIIFAVIAVINYIVYFLGTTDKSVSIINLICAILFSIIAINILLKMLYDKKHPYTDDDMEKIEA